MKKLRGTPNELLALALSLAPPVGTPQKEVLSPALAEHNHHVVARYRAKPVAASRQAFA